MRVIHLEQDTPEWHAWRAEGIGASEAAAAAGVCPFKTRAQLWAEKTGIRKPEDLSDNPHVQRGVKGEPVARRVFERENGVFLMPVCGEHDEHSFIRASLDGDGKDPVEIKCPNPRKLDRIRQHLPEGAAEVGCRIDQQSLEVIGLGYYWPQLQQQMLVADRNLICLYVFDVEAEEGIKLWVMADEEYQAWLLERLVEFWSLVQEGKMPELDPERDVFHPGAQDDPDTASRWEAHESEWIRGDKEVKDLERKLKTLKKKRDEARDAMVALMGDYLRGEGEGVKVTRYTKRGTVDYKKVIDDYLPDLESEALEGYRKPASSQVSVTPKQEGGKDKAA